VTAHYSIATLADENSGENPDVLSAENTSDPLFQVPPPLVVDLYSHSSIGKSKQVGSQSSKANRFEENAVRNTTMSLTATHFTTSTGQSSPPPGEADQNDLLGPDGLVACDGSASASSSNLSLNASSGSCCVPAQSGWGTGLSGGTAEPALHGHRISPSSDVFKDRFSEDGQCTIKRAMVLSESDQLVNGDVATVSKPGNPETALAESITCTGTLPKIWHKAFPPAPFEMLPAVLSRRRDCLAMNWDNDDEEEDVDNDDVADEDDDNDLDAAFDSGILYSPVRSKTRTILEQPTPTAIPSTHDSDATSSATLKCTDRPTEVEISASVHTKDMHKTEPYTSHGTLSSALDIWPLPPPPPQFDDPTQMDEKASRMISDITKSKLKENGADKCTGSLPIPVESLNVESEKCADKVERCALTDPLTPLLQNCLQSTSVYICSEVSVTWYFFLSPDYHSLSQSVSQSVSHSLHPSLRLSLVLSVCVSVFLSLSLSVCLCLSPPVCLSACLPL
ncbi:hypothetical protein FBUS_10061, partial [Fasciolopsis buskii]